MTASGDSYCGIFCDACSVRVFGQTGRGDGFIACAPPGEASCGGCKSDTVFAGCRGCELRACAVGRNVAHCADCADYPCKRYKAWQSARWLLPHLAEAPASLQTIRRQGLDRWGEAQQKRWACPSCGAPFSWYAQSCAMCGQSLAGRALPLSGARKLLCSLALPLARKRALKKSAAQAR